MIHNQVLIQFTINYSSIYLKRVCYYFCIFVITFWLTQNFSISWKTAIIIPVPRPGKVHSYPGSYRPIALTGCLSKTMVRMVNSCLTWYLERHLVIPEYQSGFRRRRSTVDNLVTLQTSIRDAFVGRKHMVSIFLIWRRLMILPGNMVFY